MFILLLESKNVEGEVLRLQKELDHGRYTILRGEYTGEQGRFQQKGSYADLGNALGVYCEVMKGFVKDLD